MNHKRVDANQAEIVKALRAAGMSVRSTAAIGKGFPDLAVGCHGKNLFLEIKNGALPPYERELTKDEVAFIESWRGQVMVVYSAQDAMEQIERAVFQVG